jgi:hypothetical protein
LAAREDGYFVLGYTRHLFQDNPYSELDVYIRLFDHDGTQVGEEIRVNQPYNPEQLDPLPPVEIGDEKPDGNQRSVTLSFDDAGNIVCSWVGPRLMEYPDPNPSECSGREVVFARVFHWDGNENNPIEARGDEFAIDTDDHFQTTGGADANPSVALSKANDGRFVVA